MEAYTIKEAKKFILQYKFVRNTEDWRKNILSNYEDSNIIWINYNISIDNKKCLLSVHLTSGFNWKHSYLYFMERVIN